MKVMARLLTKVSAKNIVGRCRMPVVRIAANDQRTTAIDL